MKTKKFLYGIRDTQTGKIINSKCNKNGKYYEMVSHTKNKVETLNNKLKSERYELVTFELVEIK